MPAQVHGTAGLVFGVPVVVDIILQDVKSNRDGQLAHAYGEDGDEVGFSIYRTNVWAMTGSYIFTGADIVTDLGDAITIAAAGPTGGVYVVSFDRTRKNDAFQTGSFNAHSVDEIA